MDDFASFSSDPVAEAPAMNGSGDMLGDSFATGDDAGFGMPAETPAEFAAAPASAAADDDDFFSAPAPAPVESGPSSAVLQWQEEQRQKLSELEAQEVASKEQMRAAAAEERELFYAQRTKQIEAKQQSNIEQEKVNSYSASESVWSAAVELVDMNAKVAEGRTDLTRMKQMFLKLKHNEG